MQSIKKIILPLATVLLLAACKTKPTPYTTIDGFAEGTSYHIVYNDPQGRDLTLEIQNFFTDFENVLSIYNPTSLVSRINRGETDTAQNKWFARCFELATQVSAQTDGKFDITLRPLISAYGFGGEGGPRVLTDFERDSMLRMTGYRRVTMQGGRIIKEDPLMELDFNAIAKGYSVDLLSEMMDSLGIRDYIVEVGGEIFCRGVSPKGAMWRVGLDRPTEGNYIPGNDLQAVISLTGLGFATSGNYRKFAYNDAGEKVTHTIDPRTGRSTTHNLLSATIIAPNCALADGYATACMVAGLDGSIELLARHPELEAYLIYADPDGSMKVYNTKNIEARIEDL